MMNKMGKQYIEDPDTDSKLSLAILMAYGILITVFPGLIGVIYGFSQMIDKLNM
ncbi:MAG: hypothetical protein P1P83_05555 [Bacteroidales bacterium]|nr:hypothetical protein [Bacteroidales bacterium]